MKEINCTQKLLFSWVHCYSNLDGLGPLYLVVTCGGNRENSVKSSNNSECHMEEAQQHRPVEGYQGGHHVFQCIVLFIIYLLFQILHRQCLKQIKW